MRAHLSLIGPATSDMLTEMAALRGLRRIGARAGTPLGAEDESRLRSLEEEISSAVKREPGAAVQVAGALLWMDGAAAIEWLGRAGSAATCMDAIHRSIIYEGGGDHGQAREALRVCKPATATERTCLAWAKRRAGL